MVIIRQYLAHYNDVIKNAIASQTTASPFFAQLLVQAQSEKISKLRVTGICAGNSPVTGEYPAQKSVTRKLFPFDDVLMIVCVCSTLFMLNSWEQHPVVMDNCEAVE